jgi:hypothetical protein
MAKYKVGTKVWCYVGSEPTKVSGTILDSAHYNTFVNMQGKSLVEFDKPIKLGSHQVVKTTLSNQQIERVR